MHSFAPLFVPEFSDFHKCDRKEYDAARCFLAESLLTGDEPKLKERIVKAFQVLLGAESVHEEKPGDQGRADIVLWANGEIVGVVEIKTGHGGGHAEIQSGRFMDLSGNVASFLITFRGDHLNVYGATQTPCRNVPLDPADANCQLNSGLKLAYHRLDSVVICQAEEDKLASFLGKLVNGFQKLSHSLKKATTTNVVFPFIGEGLVYTDHIKGLVFKATEKSEPRIVKFVRGHYGKDAHNFFHGVKSRRSEKPFAPRLVEHKELRGLGSETSFLSFIVMEQVVGAVPLFYVLDELDAKEDSHRISTLCSNLRELLAVVVAAPFVHGDLRPVNILVDLDNDVHIVDFDWAGKEGKAKYSPRVSSHAHWFIKAGGHAKPNADILKHHDVGMLEAIIKHLENLR